jgi:hypothetical protein
VKDWLVSTFALAVYYFVVVAGAVLCCIVWLALAIVNPAYLIAKRHAPLDQK